jgi:hypothetical protein
LGPNEAEVEEFEEEVGINKLSAREKKAKGKETKEGKQGERSKKSKPSTPPILVTKASTAT